MRAAVFHEYGGPLAVEEVADPAPPDDGVVRRGRRDRASAAPTGTPGRATTRTSRRRTSRGTSSRAPSWPSGPEVRRVAVGDRVTVPFCLGCGACASCRAGETQVCDHDYQPGFTG